MHPANQHPEHPRPASRRPVRQFPLWQLAARKIYNPDTHKFLGKNSSEWFRFAMFYAVFYAVLTIMIVVCMAALLARLEKIQPILQQEGSIIGTNPGLGFRPFQLEDEFLIKYDSKKPEKWVKLLNEFLTPYYQQNFSNVTRCHFGMNRSPKNSVCPVSLKFGNCSKRYNYGYTSNSPCVFIKLNKIFGWQPKVFTSAIEDMPWELITKLEVLPKPQRKQIWVTCEGLDEEDRKNFEGFIYNPTSGFPIFYYPYENVKNYLSPLVAVQILNPKPGVTVKIECRAWAKNINYRRYTSTRDGAVYFEIHRV